MENTAGLYDHLQAIYGGQAAGPLMERFTALMASYAGRIPRPRLSRLSQRDAILITYGDQVSQPGEAPLHTLAQFCAEHLSGVVSGIHLLPFFPYSSDDGFSVIDYLAVDPALGSWSDIEHFRQHFYLI
jgi:sucrose phosphorylase